MQPLVLLRVVSTVNNWVTALMTAHCHLCVESVLQTCILLRSVRLLIIVLIFFLLRLSLQATQRLPRKAKRWWKGSNNKPRKRNSPSVQNARSAQGMIRHEKLRRRNESNARQSERGIDIVRKNRKSNVKESMKRSMKRNLTDNRKRKRHRDDHDDCRKEHRRDDRPGERGDRECDHDHSASDRSSHPHHGFFLESSSDDDDKGWTKVSYRRSKSRSH